eukprot:gene15659-18567_t
MGLQVDGLMDLKLVGKDNPYKYVRAEVSKVFKEVDKRLPEAMRESHRVANPKSVASEMLELAFKRKQK